MIRTQESTGKTVDEARAKACALLGVKIGNVFGSRFEAKAEIAGGVILILLGLKILLEHLGVLA